MIRRRGIAVALVAPRKIERHATILRLCTRRKITSIVRGVTNDLPRRLFEHRSGQCKFTSKYHISRLVYFETTENIISAIEREKQIKAWRRSKKLALISSLNPGWDDLAEAFFGKPTEVSSTQAGLLSGIGSPDVQIPRCARNDSGRADSSLRSE
jgi:putative endonuclease